MNINRLIAYISLATALLAAIILASLPFRFPGSTIAWKPIAIISVPAIILVALLFLRLVMPLKPFRTLLLVFAALSSIATVVGWMSPIILAIFLLALGALFLRSKPNDTAIRPA